MFDLMSEVTRILSAIQQGDPAAAGELLPLVYDELRKLAAHKMAQEAAGQTLQPTALVHEAYLRLVGQDDEQVWDSRGHFFAAAAEAMQRLLVDRARRKATLKRGGQKQRVDLDALEPDSDDHAADLLVLSDALAVLEGHDRQAAQLVKLRYFAGLTHQQAAETLGLSRRAADRLWALAKAWLYQQLNEA
jgi:RNA polymerase sigma factor (TIGR02999 family)